MLTETNLDNVNNSALNDHEEVINESRRSNDNNLNENCINDQRLIILKPEHEEETKKIDNEASSKNKKEEECEEIYVVFNNSEEEDENTFDIIDGIMILSFKTESELKEQTLKDEKLRMKNNALKRKSIRRSNGKSISNNLSSIGKKLSTTSLTANDKQQQQQQDSAFVSSELDDYLDRKNRSSNANSNRRKSTIGIQYDEELFDSSVNFARSIDYESDSSSYLHHQAQQQQKLSRSIKLSNHSKSTIKNSRTKKSSPEMILINETLSELDDNKLDKNNLDNTYLRCIAQAENGFKSSIEKMEGKFVPSFLDDQRIRIALSTLHSNILSNVLENSISSPISMPDLIIDKPINLTETSNSISINASSSSKNKIIKKSTNVNNKVRSIANTSTASPLANDNNATIKLDDLNSVGSNLENASNVSKSNKKNILFKLEDDDCGNLNNLLIESETFSLDDKQPSKRKIKHDYHEEVFDITKIISKHSKRDIRLPARYHESGILVGSQWILPNFEENKNRIVNTGGNKKQSTKINKDKKSTAATATATATANKLINKSDNNLINSSIYEASVAATLLNLELNPEDLMTEDEDAAATNDNKLINKSISNDNSTISTINNNKKSTKKISKSKDEKLRILKELYRKLYYANQPKRIDYYVSQSIKPRVNKNEVVEEGCQTIDNLKSQNKKLNFANNSLTTWNNKLKLCLKSIERKEILSEEEVKKLVNSNQNNLRKVNDAISSGKLF